MSTQPFCCHSAIPYSFTHLLPLIPESTTHVVVSTHAGASSAGLTSTFLASTVLNFIWSSESKPPTPDAVVLRPNNSSFRAIIQITTRVPTNDPLKPASEASREYYVPYGHNDRARIITGEREKLYWVSWKEISRQDAEWCIKPAGSGLDIGDGERWLELSGKEKLWCDHHRVFWELRAYVRQT